MIRGTNKSQALPLSFDQRNALRSLSCMADGSEFIPAPEPELYICDTGHEDYSRDILGSNIASRFGGKQ